MEFLRNFIKDTFDTKESNNEISDENITYYQKYMSYKKKYIELKNKLKIKQLGGEVGKFDIIIAGQTNPTNVYQKANIRYYDNKYIISINASLHNMGPMSYPIVLQEGKLYTIDTVHNTKVIRFKYQDTSDVKIIEFKNNAYFKSRLSVIKDNNIISITR